MCSNYLSNGIIIYSNVGADRGADRGYHLVCPKVVIFHLNREPRTANRENTGSVRGSGVLVGEFFTSAEVPGNRLSSGLPANRKIIANRGVCIDTLHTHWI